jgi:hypothetical protein
VISSQVHLHQIVWAKLVFEESARSDQQPVTVEPEGHVAIGSRDETRLPEAPAAAYDLARDFSPGHGLAHRSR